MPRKKKGEIFIGTSGWHYTHWKGPFYPEDLSESEMLGFYKDRLSTVEINNTFYQLPKIKTVKDWKKQVPDDFRFSVKASRYITHVKKLKDPKETLKKLFTRIKYLENSLGVILFQLPGKFGKNLERLDNFLKNLPGGKKYAFEFRDLQWHDEEVYDLLEKYKAAFCIYEYGRMQTEDVVTCGHVYIRLHGPKGAYQGKYSSKSLKSWAKKIIDWRNDGRDVYCYFDNDQKGYAPQNAIDLLEFLK
ncbi:MAG: DUF72 domain-containing protein [Simkaniaceae bacterium]